MGFFPNLQSAIKKGHEGNEGNVIYNFYCIIIYGHKDQQQSQVTLPYQPSTVLPTTLFSGEKSILPHFVKNKWSSNLHLLYKFGGDLAMIIQNFYSIYFLLQIKPVIIKTFYFKFQNVSFSKISKNINGKADKYI